MTTQTTDRTGEFGSQRSQEGDRLAALFLPNPSRGGLAASSRGYSPKRPIEIWYGEDLTESR